MSTSSSASSSSEANLGAGADLYSIGKRLERAEAEIAAYRAENERLALELDVMRRTVNLLCGTGVVWKLAHYCAAARLVAQRRQAHLWGSLDRGRGAVYKWIRKARGV